MIQNNDKLVYSALYENEEGEIQVPLVSNEVDEQEFSFDQAGWSQGQSFDIQSVQDTWSASVASIALEVAEFDPRILGSDEMPSPSRPPDKKFYCSKRKEWYSKSDPLDDGISVIKKPVPELSAFNAVKHQSGVNGEDYRPHLYDGERKELLLIDSGSQICTYPPDPGDKPDPDMFLRAVNGTRIQCYGKKDVVVRIGRKSYPIQVIKSDVPSPI